ncbi:MAG: glycoside hydrolase family 88 protein [Lachnospiraceae bacterium]|nr:glycoside hydrolase family 88 protein [Lachnospiraceae bacterium]
MKTTNFDNKLFEQYLDNYLSTYKNYKDYWNYEDGCVLLGAQYLYEATGEEKYFSFIQNYVKDLILEDGTITNYQVDKFNIDSINAGKILFFLYDKTGEEKYRKAIDFVMDQLRQHPRCKCGNFFHKAVYPNQIWLDGLYMAQPFYMAYETRYNKKEKYNDIISQFENVKKYLYDEEKGLCYHAYDESGEAFWADKKTGCSANFWLRSLGWYLMSFVDVMDHMSIEIYEQYRKLQDMYKLMLKGILQYQDPETGMFYQVPDRSDAEGNYLETSGSAMITYSILKACRMGILLKEKYADLGLEMVESILSEKLVQDVDGLHLTGICHMAGLGPENRTDRDGSVEYYLSEKIVSDDSKGVGPMMMAYAQYLMLKKESEA